VSREEYLNSLSKESLIELVKAQDEQLKQSIRGLKKLKQDYSLSLWTTDVICKAIEILEGGEK
jgi:hypothetical protein